MKRRLFVKSSMLLTSLSNIIPARTEAAFKKSKQEFYELRVYSLKNAEQEKIIEDHFQKAAIPALNRLGIKNVGVFKEMKPEGQTKMYVLIPFASLDEFTSVEEKLSKDKTYQDAG